MNIVSQPLAIDDSYSQDIIQQARDMSVEIDNYLVEERYLMEAPEETLSPFWLRNRVIRLLLDELQELGISINISTDDILDDVAMTQLVLFLRKKFTGDVLFDRLKSSEDLVEAIKDILNDDCLPQIAELMNNYFPLDEGWQFIYERATYISSNMRLVDHIQAILKRIDAYGDTDYTTRCNEIQMSKYLMYINQRNETILSLALSCFPDDGQRNPITGVIEVHTSATMKRSYVAKYMESYEHQIMRGDVMFKIIDILDLDHMPVTDERLQQINMLKQPYRLKWKHCLEAWFNLKGVATEAMCALIVASYYQVGYTLDQMRSLLQADIDKNIDMFVTTTNDDGTTSSIFLDRLNYCMNHMVMPELTGGNYETI